MHNSCPHCHTRSGLYNYFVLILSIDGWPLALLYGILVMAFAEKFNYEGFSRVFFMVLAVVPAFFSLSKKTCCENCGIEFRVVQDETKASVSASDL